MPSKDGYWRVPKLWAGETAYILAGGPGLRAVDVPRLEGANVIAVNNSYKAAIWAPVLFFADMRWPDNNGDRLHEFGGLKVTVCDAYLKNARRPGFLVVKRNMGPDGLATDSAVLQWNKSSGTCAIGLAVHFGARRIYLCGFDMRRGDPEHGWPAGRIHWHDDYPDDRQRKAGYDPFTRFLKPYPVLAEQLARRGVEVLNATPGSAITQFPMVDPGSIYPQEGKA